MEIAGCSLPNQAKQGVSQAGSKLSVKAKVAFSSGNAADRIVQGTLGQMVSPIFNDSLGVDARLVGFISGFARLLEAFLSPFFGYLSDRTTSRWGRRKPWLFGSAFIIPVLFATLWLLPSGLSTNAYGLWLLVLSILLFAAITAYSVPYDAMGMEMTRDYQERTSVMAYRAAVTRIGGFLVASLFALINLPAFANPVEGMRYVGIGCALVVFVLALIPVFFVDECRSRIRDTAMSPIRFGVRAIVENVRVTFRYRHFVVLVAANTTLCLGLTMVVHLGYYVIVYYVYGGRKGVDVGFVLSMAGYAAIVGSLIGIPLMVKLSRRWGKSSILVIALGVAMVGNILKWFCYTPAFPWLVLVPDMILALALTMVWNLIRSMVPDVVDLHELKTGERSEGMFSAVFGLMVKLGTAFALLLSGYTLEFAGFDESLQGPQSEQTVRWIRWFYVLIPGVALLFAAILLKNYSLDEDQVNENQKQLRERDAPGA